MEAIVSEVTFHPWCNFLFIRNELISITTLTGNGHTEGGIPRVGDLCGHLGDFPPQQSSYSPFFNQITVLLSFWLLFCSLRKPNMQSAQNFCLHFSFALRTFTPDVLMAYSFTSFRFLLKCNLHSETFLNYAV